jgi:hypothetical protein
VKIKIRQVLAVEISCDDRTKGAPKQNYKIIRPKHVAITE